MKDLNERIMYDEDQDAGGTEESKVIETEEGVVVIVEPDEESKPDPVEGQSEEDSSEAEEIVADEDPSYAGKTKAEVIAMHKEAVRMATESSTLASKLKQSVQTREDVRDLVTAKELRKSVDEKAKQLANIDGVIDPEGKAKAEAELELMKLDLQEKRDDERHQALVNDTVNETFLKEHKDVLKKEGFELSDDDYAKISEVAKGYAENGRITHRSVTKAIIDEFGVEKYDSFRDTKTEAKLRDDLQAAGRKETASTATTASRAGKSKTISVEGMSITEYNRVRDTLGPADKQKLDAAMEKRDAKSQG